MATGLPVLALDTFPANAPRRPWYAARLAWHVAQYPVVSTPHAHSFYLLLYVTHGGGTHTVDLITYELRPGSVFFLSPGQVHHWTLSADADGFIVFFAADFLLAHYPGGRLYEYPFFTPAQPPVAYLPPDEAELRPLFERVLTEAGAETAALNQGAVIAAWLYLILELAARRFPLPRPTAAALGVQQLRDFSRLLNQHYRTKKQVQDYADLLHLTPNHLNAVCRRVVGSTARALIHERVLTEARRLLTHSAQSVAQIAASLGYPDAAYFTRFFRQHVGLAPEQFRRGAAASAG